MKVGAEKEQICYEEYDPVALKNNQQKELFSVLIVVDDCALWHLGGYGCWGSV